MGRIRSVHPEQWTDDQFVTCSPLARLLALAVRNYADDHGVFEWNPVKLKMQCLPNDNCDSAALLAELEATNQVRRFESGGKAYGLIRSFGKFQRPKKPSYKYPLPENAELLALLCIGVPNQYGTGTEPGGKRSGKSSADGKGKGKGKGGEDKKGDGADAPFDPLTVELPDWLPAPKWAEWIAYRRERRISPYKPSTIPKLFEELGELARSGHDVGKVIDHSIAQGYQGLFPPKNGAKPSPQSPLKLPVISDEQYHAPLL